MATDTLQPESLEPIIRPLISIRMTNLLKFSITHAVPTPRYFSGRPVLTAYLSPTGFKEMTWALTGLRLRSYVFSIDSWGEGFDRWLEVEFERDGRVELEEVVVYTDYIFRCESEWLLVDLLNGRDMVAEGKGIRNVRIVKGVPDEDGDREGLAEGY
ncbi:hypothetical protein HDV00_000592 [Rhizophlyctis rosea]|nr:hypothetical protein HDV00_000592 [Rhizophlyctis rosea]